MILAAILSSCARHGRLLLIIGLLVGIALPGLAQFILPALTPLVACLLLVAALRIGKANLLSVVMRPQAHIWLLVFGYQLLLPLLAILLLHFWLAVDAELLIAVSLLLCAPSISGGPSLVALSGHDPAPALQLLVAGTSLLPLSFSALAWLLPWQVPLPQVLSSIAWLLLLICGAGLLANVIARLFPSIERRRPELDGLSALLMALIVVGLMPAVGSALLNQPLELLYWLALACGLNIGLQLISFYALRTSKLAPIAVPVSIVAGNRNILLFLAAMPAAVIEPLMLFVGCYQIPMYLTPLLLKRFYSSAH